MLFADVGASDPGGAVDHARVEQVANAGRRLRAQHCLTVFDRADIALDQAGIGGEVGFGCLFYIVRGERNFGALGIDFTVARQTNYNQRALALWRGECQNHVLQGVGGGPLATIPAVDRCVGKVNQGSDGRRVW